MSYSIRTTNWNNMNRYRKTKAVELTPAQRKRAIVFKILKRYDLWHSGVVVKKLRNLNNRHVTRIVITEAYTLAELMHAIGADDRQRIKHAINQRINLRTRGVTGRLTYGI